MMKWQLNQYPSLKHQCVFLSLCLIVFFSQANAQTLSVQGRVTASRFAVQNASVTFIDNADTTIKFSALTDAAGFYQVGLITSVESNPNGLPMILSWGKVIQIRFLQQRPYLIGLEKVLMFK